jgi:hypothetical protein
VITLDDLKDLEKKFTHKEINEKELQTFINKYSSEPNVPLEKQDKTYEEPK